MEFNVKTTKKQEIINITEKVNDIVKKINVKEGICNIFSLHTTASIIINENDDPGISTDIMEWLSLIVDENREYNHNKVCNNATAHIRSNILGHSINVPVKDSKLHLGRWQAIMLVELDGPRERGINIEVLSKK